MKALYVRRLFLWPRYQAAVKDSLEKNECEVCLLAQAVHPILGHCLNDASFCSVHQASYMA